ncbi:MAG: LysR family transcriptional regulator [Eubacteriales bacterium]|nr:LysR family transcriptional regulator [Eubacteriales bacterium]
MNTRSMQYFAAIAQEQSLSGAARRLSVSQPTLSVFLAELESELGMDLFVRDKKKLIPTPAGRIYLDAAKRILQIQDQTCQTIYRLTHEPLETIAVGATPLRGSIMVAQIFPEFSKRYPNVRLDLREAYMRDLRSLVKDGAVSFSLGSCYDSEDPDFDYIIVSREEVILCLPSFHRLAPLAAKPGEPLTALDVRQLADTPFVCLSHGTSIRAISDNIFASAGIRPTVVFETDNNLVVSNMIRQGAGAGFLPRSAMREQAQDVVYFSISPKYYLSLSIIVAKNRQLTEAERYLAYLVIRRDKDNVLYQPSMNQYARRIFREFEQKG